MYERIAGTAVDAHIYGLRDWSPPSGLPLVVHTGDAEEFRSSWFVVHVPPAGSERAPTALLAIDPTGGSGTGSGRTTRPSSGS